MLRYAAVADPIEIVPRGGIMESSRKLTVTTKIGQLVGLMAGAYGLGLYTPIIIAGRWDGGNLAGLVGMSVLVIVNLSLLIYDFAKA